MGRLYAIIGLALFLLVGWWFVSHSFVIVRLTSVLGLWGAICAVFFAIFFIRRLFR